MMKTVHITNKHDYTLCGSAVCDLVKNPTGSKTADLYVQQIILGLTRFIALEDLYPLALLPEIDMSFVLLADEQWCTECLNSKEFGLFLLKVIGNKEEI